MQHGLAWSTTCGPHVKLLRFAPAANLNAVVRLRHGCSWLAEAYPTV